MKKRLVCAQALVMLALAAPLSAQVTYVRDIPLPDAHPYLFPTTGVSVAETQRFHWLLAHGPNAWVLPDSAASGYVPAPPLPAISVSTVTQATFLTIDDFNRFIFFTGPQKKLQRVNIVTNIAATYTIDLTVSPDARNSIAADSGNTLVLVVGGATNALYRATLDDTTLTGTTSVLIGTQGTGPGQLSMVGKGAFGPDHLFYLLDQANGANRVQIFDVTGGLTEGQRFKGSFPVSNAASLSAGMAISPTGHIYIGDGAGGFSEYDLLGTHLGDFTFTPPGTPDTNGADGATGAPFLDLDQNGYIYVYTPATGLHQYFDASGITIPGFSVSVTPSSVTGGAKAAGLVTLPSVVTTPTVVTLSSDIPFVASVPATVTVPEGAASKAFKVTTTHVPASTIVTVTASFTGGTTHATLTVDPVDLASVTLAANVVIGGAHVKGTVTLNGASPDGGATVTLGSDNAAATVPPTVTIPAGHTSAGFQVTTTPVAAVVGPITITGTYVGAPLAAMLTVQAPAVASVTAAPAKIHAGASSTGTVKLNGAAPAGGMQVTLASSGPAATVPPTVLVPEGATRATFTIASHGVAAPTPVTLSATGGGVTKTVVVTINP